MYSVVLADTFKRWQTLKGNKALLCTGTDEHGMKIQRAAALEDMAPKQFCDINSDKFKVLAEKVQMDNDFFVRTTDADHADAVRHFWFLLRERGYIYEARHEGWYCVSDECFYPEGLVEKRIEPMTGKAIMASVETGSAVEWTEEKTYHFRMTALRDRLLAFYEENPEWVVPAARMSEVTYWVKNHLEDLSISRPVSRLEWGIRVPDDPSQTIYVWVDALINYITKAGFPGWAPGQEHTGGWPADLHIIGKDILRFHCVYWPALLMALGLPLPKRILSHAHWTLGRKKMSKSIGNVVNPYFAIDRWGVDTMRYYMIHDGGVAHDADYGNQMIVDRYKNGLQWGLGNLLGRITRPKLWNVGEAVQNARGSSPPSFVEEEGEIWKAQREMLGTLPGRVSARMDALDPGAALREIMSAVYLVRPAPPRCVLSQQGLLLTSLETNKFVQETEPWKQAKMAGDESKAKVMQTVYLAAESLRKVGILLQPFMPNKAAELLDVLGVDESVRGFVHAAEPDFTYGVPKISPGKSADDALFPPLAVED